MVLVLLSNIWSLSDNENNATMTDLKIFYYNFSNMLKIDIHVHIKSIISNMLKCISGCLSKKWALSLFVQVTTAVFI